jgi:hypothetical protein
MRELTLTIPPGARDGENYLVNLGAIGIDNLVLDVPIVVV